MFKNECVCDFSAEWNSSICFHDQTKSILWAIFPVPPCCCQTCRPQKHYLSNDFFVCENKCWIMIEYDVLQMNGIACRINMLSAVKFSSHNVHIFICTAGELQSLHFHVRIDSSMISSINLMIQMEYNSCGAQIHWIKWLNVRCSTGPILLMGKSIFYKYIVRIRDREEAQILTFELE